MAHSKNHVFGRASVLHKELSIAISQIISIKWRLWLRNIGFALILQLRELIARIIILSVNFGSFRFAVNGNSISCYKFSILWSLQCSTEIFLQSKQQIRWRIPPQKIMRAKTTNHCENSSDFRLNDYHIIRQQHYPRCSSKDVILGLRKR